MAKKPYVAPKQNDTPQDDVKNDIVVEQTSNVSESTKPEGSEQDGSDIDVTKSEGPVDPEPPLEDVAGAAVPPVDAKGGEGGEEKPNEGEDTPPVDEQKNAAVSENQPPVEPADEDKGDQPPVEGSDAVIPPVGAGDKNETLPEGPKDPIPPAEVTPPAAEVKPPMTPPKPAVSGVNDQQRQREDAIRLEAQTKYGRGPIGWSVKECHDYLKKNILPAKTHRDNWVTDVRRAKDLKTWTLSECLDFVEGLLRLGKDVDIEQVWGEIFHRFKIPGNATREDVKAFVLNQTPIPATESGQLLHDVTRDAKPVEFWTYVDLRAALLGEIKTPHDKATLVKALRNILGVSEQYSEERLLDTLTTERYASMKDTLLVSKLEEYKKARMTKGNFVNPKLHGDAHAMFYRLVAKLFTREYREFKEAWTIVLDFVKREENTLFNIKRRYEHWSMVSLTGTDLRAAEDLTNLLTMSADPVVRNQGLSEDVIRNLTRHLCTDDQMQMLFTYYAIK